MLPLAMILAGRGAVVAGSDRALDQGRLAAKFDYLRAADVALFAQDGSGINSSNDTLVASAAVEDTVPDVAAALRVGARRVSRAELLSTLFNGAELPIGIAGTSGKSTTTAMIGWILSQADADPTIMNGAAMKNFVSADAPFASARIGSGPAFVSEIDESDGSIEMFTPAIAVLNNIALDHKSMDELRALFNGYIDRATHAVLNLDNDETKAIANKNKDAQSTYSLHDKTADFYSEDVALKADGVGFSVVANTLGERADVDLKMPGRHNVSNGLAAIAASVAAGVSFPDAAKALSTFSGVKRRLEYVGVGGGVTIIDDFAHNPDKISASLTTLSEFSGRVLILFQPHGFGPLKKMRQELIGAFADHMRADDILLMPEPVYFGGTVDRSVSSSDIVEGVRSANRDARGFATREECGEALLEVARAGDRIVVMGARDDTLSEFAQDLCVRLDKRG